MDERERLGAEIVEAWRSATGPGADASARVMGSVLASVAPAAIEAGAGATGLAVKIAGVVGVLGTAGVIALAVLGPGEDEPAEVPVATAPSAPSEPLPPRARRVPPAPSEAEETTPTHPPAFPEAEPEAEPVRSPRKTSPITPSIVDIDETLPSADTPPSIQRPRTMTRDELAAEARLIAGADRAIRSGRLDQADRLLVQHRRDFSDGMLGVEAEGLAVLVACARREPNAGAATEQFLDEHGGGGLASRVRAACVTAKRNGTEP